MTDNDKLSELSSRVADLSAEVKKDDNDIIREEQKEHREHKCSTKLKCHLACIFLGLAISLFLAYLQTNIYVLTGFPWVPNALIEAIDRIKHIS